MPSKTPAQHKLMESVAHNSSFAEAVGIPQKVGKEFAEADKDKSAHEVHLESRDYHKRQMEHHHSQMEDAHAHAIATHPDDSGAEREHKIHHLAQEKYHEEKADYHQSERKQTDAMHD